MKLLIRHLVQEPQREYDNKPIQRRVDLYTYIEPYTSTQNSYLIMRSGQTFSINVSASEAATKLGKSGSGSTTATADNGVYTLKYASGIQYGFTALPGAAKVIGFERSYTGGEVASDGSSAVPARNVAQSLSVQLLVRWEDTYQYLQLWETEGLMAWYDVSIGRSWIFRGALEGVTLNRAGIGASLVYLDLKFRSVGL